MKDYEKQDFNPRFQVTFRFNLDWKIEIEIEQIHPKTKQGETFKQYFIARRIDVLLPYMMLDFKNPRLKPPDYTLSSPILKLDLAQYSYFINDYSPGWTTENALSGRYIYGLGQFDVAVGIDVWIEYFADGWIKDTATGHVLELYHRYPGEYM